MSTITFATRLAQGATAHVRRLAVLGGLATLLALLVAGTALAAGANQGLGPGVKVPAWAMHKAVHFFNPGAFHRGESSFYEDSLPGTMNQRSETAAGTNHPLLYKTGNVQYSHHIDVIFWGSKWNEGAGPAIRTQLLKMYEGLAGSEYQNILDQYFDSSSRHVASNVYVASYTDTSVSAPSQVNDKAIREEVGRAISQNGWHAELDSQFVVLSAAGTSYESSFIDKFCGYHQLSEVPGLPYTYTFIPYFDIEPFSSCIWAVDNPRDNIGNAVSAVASHEYAESATDPEGNAWRSEDGWEVADICATGDHEIKEGPLNGSWVEALWDNRMKECSLGDFEPYTPEVQSVTLPEYTTKIGEIRLRGWYDAEGSESHYHFEYGPTSAYGSKVPSTDINGGASFAGATTTQQVGGMPEGIYHYRLVTTNGSGTSYGEDRLALSPGFTLTTLPKSGTYTQARLAGVSCASRQTCISVGTAWDTERKKWKSISHLWNGTNWSALQSVDPTEEEYDSYEFLSISCTSSTACTAVGAKKRTVSGLETAPLAERWNGTSWSVQSPSTAGVPNAEFQAVSCVSSTECLAVGDYNSVGGAETTLAERWNGTSWTVTPTPIIGGVYATRLTGISCTSASFCVATGFSQLAAYQEEASPLVERWDGTSWTAMITPSVSAAKLNAVSCTSSSACTAVGVEKDIAGGREMRTLVERWNGSEWSIQSTPSLEAGKLMGVSCAAPSACTAVGKYFSESFPYGEPNVLVERWNGSTWSMAAAPPPAHTASDWLAGVSCFETSDCVAVSVLGSAEEQATAPVVVAEGAQVNETGATLKAAVSTSGLEATYQFEYGTSTAYGIVAPTPATLVRTSPVTLALTGLQPHTTYHYRAVASNAKGTAYGEDRSFTTRSWSAAIAPSMNSASSGVSCPSTTFCLAVGKLVNGSGQSLESGLVREWSGTAWHAVAEPASPSGAKHNALVGVACVSTETCVSVGNYASSSGVESSLAEKWSRTTGWSLQATPSPAEATSSHLVAVSCSSLSACTAVGSYSTSSGTHGLAERWNGTEWSVQATPAPSGSSGTELSSVSCSSSSECLAVGHYRFFEGSAEHWATVAERWNGAEWLIRSTPNPSEARFSTFSSISCVSSTSCVAVGWSQTATGVRSALGEAWNGSAWEIQTTPNEPGGGTALNSVSCTAPTACTAVGNYPSGANVETAFAERWNGTWSLQEMPAEQYNNKLSGVSCPSSQSCMAIGRYLVGGKVEQGAAEQWNGVEWTFGLTPGMNMSFSSVACTSSSACLAVGRAHNGTEQGLGEAGVTREWNGAQWLSPEIASVPGAKATVPTAVACPVTEICEAVGYEITEGAVEVNLAMRWNKKEKHPWSVQALHAPSEATSSRLLSVSCTTSSSCEAVGYYTTLTSPGRLALSYGWNGSEWALQTTPNPSGGTEVELAGVSCPSIAECMAVGRYRVVESGKEFIRTLAERWNSAAGWSIVSMPRESTNDSLAGVSCASWAACVAVGWKQTSAGLKLPLVETWNGSSWTFASLPSEASGDVLAGVSCTASTSCVAVGTYTDSSNVEHPLAMQLEGSKWLQLNPLGLGSGSGLAGVSCTSGEACMTVGRSTSMEGLEEAFADRY